MENKYLEKVAAMLPRVSGLWGGIDRAVGKAISTTGKAFKPLKTLGPEDAIRKTITTTDRAGNISKATGINAKVIGNAKNDLRTLSGAPGSAARKTAVAQRRAELGLVKDPSKRIITKDSQGKVLNIKNTYSPPTPSFDSSGANPYLKHIDAKKAHNDIANRSIHTARAKVGLGAAALAGVGVKAYNKGQSSFGFGDYSPSQQSPQYY